MAGSYLLVIQQFQSQRMLRRIATEVLIDFTKVDLITCSLVSKTCALPVLAKVNAWKTRHLGPNHVLRNSAHRQCCLTCSVHNEISSLVESRQHYLEAAEVFMAKGIH